MKLFALPATCILAAAFGALPTAAAQSYSIPWHSIDGGGTTTPSTGGPFSLAGTIGQPDAGAAAGAPLACTGGFWAGAAGPASCYANCDGSTALPLLNVGDFVCFQQRFASGDPYANCDASTMTPVLNVADFVCFQSRFAAGCH